MNCSGDRCDNDPNEYMLCDRWQSEHPICRGSYDVNYADWIKTQQKPETD